MDPYLYKPIFLHLAVLLSIMLAIRPISRKREVNLGYHDDVYIFIVGFVLTLWLGLRPVSWAFGDTGNYARIFENINLNHAHIDFRGEWVFDLIMITFKKIGLDISAFFLFIEFVYISSTFYACKRIHSNLSFIPITLTLTSFSFFSYGTNGLRQGIACSLALLAIALYKEKKRLIPILLLFVAYSTHNSVAVLIAAILLCSFYTKTKVYFYLWVLSIIVSLLIPGITDFIFQNFSFVGSERNLDYYSNTTVDMSVFSQSGFRYDFLLYSMIPLLMGYYEIKKGFNDTYYRLLLNIYIVTNSFWVLMNQSWLSNRIAYISWCMYSIVLIYPYIERHYVKNRKVIVSSILLGNASFTYIMWLLGKYM